MKDLVNLTISGDQTENEYRGCFFDWLLSRRMWVYLISLVASLFMLQRRYKNPKPFIGQTKLYADKGKEYNNNCSMSQNKNVCDGNNVHNNKQDFGNSIHDKQDSMPIPASVNYHFTRQVFKHI